MGTLLIDDNPLQVLPKLAEKIGLNEAIVLQQLHYWLNRSDKVRDGAKWVFNSYPGWKEQFPFWSIRTIQRTFLRLESLGLLRVGNFNKMKGDLTKWYTVDYAGVEALEQSSLLRENPSCQNGVMASFQNGATIVPKRNDPSCQNVPTITRDYVPEITPEISGSMPPARKERELPRRPVVTEADKIADYFARKINSDKDSLTRAEYIAINQLVSEGFNLERCIPGIDNAVNGIRGRGQVVSSFLACPRSIRQLDPKAAQPVPIQSYHKPAPFEQAKKVFREEDYQLTPAQIERNRRKKEEDAAWAAADRAARLGQPTQLQA
jgi:hypothetical protein